MKDLVLIEISTRKYTGFVFDLLGSKSRSLLYLNISRNNITIQIFFREFNF